MTKESHTWPRRFKYSWGVGAHGEKNKKKGREEQLFDTEKIFIHRTQFQVMSMIPSLWLYNVKTRGTFHAQYGALMFPKCCYINYFM